jgi:hypothetical protein
LLDLLQQPRDVYSFSVIAADILAKTIQAIRQVDPIL